MFMHYYEYLLHICPTLCISLPLSRPPLRIFSRSFPGFGLLLYAFQMHKSACICIYLNKYTVSCRKNVYFQACKWDRPVVYSYMFIETKGREDCCGALRFRRIHTCGRYGGESKKGLILYFLSKRNKQYSEKNGNIIR